jgi:hypothetical protein
MSNVISAAAMALRTSGSKVPGAALTRRVVLRAY